MAQPNIHNGKAEADDKTIFNFKSSLNVNNLDEWLAQL